MALEHTGLYREIVGEIPHSNDYHANLERAAFHLYQAWATNHTNAKAWYDLRSAERGIWRMRAQQAVEGQR